MLLFVFGGSGLIGVNTLTGGGAKFSDCDACTFGAEICAIDAGEKVCWESPNVSGLNIWKLAVEAGGGAAADVGLNN